MRKQAHNSRVFVRILVALSLLIAVAITGCGGGSSNNNGGNGGGGGGGGGNTQLATVTVTAISKGDNLAAPGVSVSIVGTSLTGLTDSNGRYTFLNVPLTASSLKVSVPLTGTGYQTTVTVGANSYDTTTAALPLPTLVAGGSPTIAIQIFGTKSPSSNNPPAPPTP